MGAIWLSLGMGIGGGRGAGSAGDPAYYVFRDQFTADLDAAWNDTGANFTVEGDRLILGGAAPAVWSEPLEHTAGIARATGRALAAWVLVGDRNGDFFLGWSSATGETDPRTDGHGWVMEDGALAVSEPGAKIAFAGTAGNAFEVRPLEHLFVAALNDRGAVYLLRPFDTGDGSPALSATWPLPALAADEAWVLHVAVTDTDATLHPAISANAGLGWVDDVRVVDVADWASADFLSTLADRFTRIDSATDPGPLWTTTLGTAGISSNRLYFPSVPGRVINTDVGFTDGAWCFTANPGASASNGIYCLLRYLDGSNFIYLTNNAGSTEIHLRKVVATVDTAIDNTAFTWNANTDHRIIIRAIGNKYAVTVNGVDPFGGVVTDAGSAHLTRTGVGMQVGSDAVRFDDVAGFPAVVTLPEEILHGLVPQPWTVGATLASDAFTGSNGTMLTAHDANWTSLGGTSEIQSNRAVVTVGATYAITGDDLEVSADLILPATATPLRAGLYARYLDSDNWVRVRIYEDGTGTDELEVEESVGGSASIVHKTQFGSYYTNGATVALKLQVRGDLLRYLLDGEPCGSYVTAIAAGDPGLYCEDANDNGTVFDNFTVTAVS
jgi:hypothetical protein